MDTFIKIALIAFLTLIATMTIGCGGAINDTTIKTGLNVNSEETTKRDVFGNTSHVLKVDERDPYEYCVTMHPNAKWMCDEQQVGYGGPIMIGAPPNMYAGSALGGGWSQPPTNTTPSANKTASNDGPTKEQMAAVIGRVKENSDDIRTLNCKVNRRCPAEPDNAGK